MPDAALLVLITFVPALAAAAALTPLARLLALRADLVAAVRPDRLHREERPYGGGIAIAATLALFFGFAALMPEVLPSGRPPEVYETWFHAAVPPALRLGLGGILFFVIGLIDDRWALRALPKLALQFLAAAIVVLGFGINATAWLALPGLPEAASILWIVAVVNAVNLFDHADGLAGTFCLVALLALAGGQVLAGQVIVPGLALVAAGAVAGFLIYNFPPARLFLGDAGSSLLGYLLAALMMMARYWWPDLGSTGWVVLVPVAILAVPLFDMACVLGSRLARRESPFVGDATSHLGHRMLARGRRPRSVVFFVAAVTALAGAGSAVMYEADGPMLIAAWGAVALALVAVWLARRPADARTGVASGLGHDGAWPSTTAVLAPETLARWLRRACIVLGAAGLLVLPQVTCNASFAGGVAGAPGPVFALTLGLGFWLMPILLAASWAAERRIVLPHPWLLVPAALAVAAVAISTAAADDKSSALVRGAQVAGLWVAMAALGQALRGSGERRFLLACLVAAAVTSAALAVQQAAQGLPATWEYFQQHRLEILAAQHIQPGSWAERALVSRFTGGVQAALGHPNVLAAFLVMGFFAAVGLVREKWSEVRTFEARILAVCVMAAAALCVVGVLLTQSRAGEAVLVVGVYWLAVAWCVRRRALRVALYVLPLAVAAVSLAAAARSENPAVESALLSLRYRLDYWQSTWQVLRTDWLTGVGLDNFGQRYLEFKLPQAPEEIGDPHNFFLSVWSKLGLAGLAALVALGAVAIHAWQRPPHPAFGHPLPPLGERDGVRGMSESLPALLAPAAIVAAPVVVLCYLLGPLMGVMVLVGMAVVVILASTEDPSRMGVAARPLASVRTACIVGLAALVLMEQIGTAVLEPPTLWAMLVLVVVSLGGAANRGLRIADCGLTAKQGPEEGVVSSIRNPRSAILNGSGLRLGQAGAFALMVLAMAIGFAYVRGLLVPVMREDAIIDAAFRSRREPPSVFDIDEAMQSAAQADPVAWEPAWIRGQAWQRVASRDERSPGQGISLDRAAEAYREALGRRPRFRQAWLGLADCALPRGAEDNPAALRQALGYLQEALRLYPTSITTHRRIADVLDSLGDYPRAIEEYREALRLDDLMPPDYRRLDPEDRKGIEGRMARLESRPKESLAPPAASP